MPSKRTSRIAVSGTANSSPATEFPLASTLEQMEIDNVEDVPAPPAVSVLTILPNTAVQATTVPAATEENNPPAPSTMRSGAETSSQSVPQSTVGIMGYRSTAPVEWRRFFPLL